MPLDLITNQLIEKNKLSSTNVELLLLKFTKSGEPPVCVCLNNESIVWNGLVWIPAKFSLDGLGQNKDGEISRPSLSFSDIFRVVTPIIDLYNGANGSIVELYIVDSIYLENTTPKDYYNLEVLSSSISGRYDVNIIMGAENLIERFCPQDMYMKNHCRFDFIYDPRCGYTGEEPSCGRTYAECVRLGNALRYGGFLGVGGIGFKI